MAGDRSKYNAHLMIATACEVESKGYTG